MDYRQWVAQVRSALAEMALQDFGYPPGVNDVEPGPSPHVEDLPSPLRGLYRAMDGLSLPDVHVGYFLDPADRILSADDLGLPTTVGGSGPVAIQVFGSDGGGGKFALGLQDGAIYYLPSSGAVRDGRYEPAPGLPVSKVANNVDDFADHLREDIEAFVRGDREHPYMAG